MGSRELSDFQFVPGNRSRNIEPFMLHYSQLIIMLLFKKVHVGMWLYK